MTHPAYGGRAHVDVPPLFSEPSEHRTMTDVAYEQLKAAIVELRIPPGERLREAAIAQGLNVSKTPVREALARLEQDGWWSSARSRALWSPSTPPRTSGRSTSSARSSRWRRRGRR